MNFTANEDMNYGGQLKGSAIISTLSVLIFSGKGVFSENRVDGYGGAICSINSIIHVLDDTEFLNNLAIKGGGVYLYQSELHCKNEIHFIENHANISGSGIHSLNSFIRLSSGGALLYMRNSAELGGGIFLTRNSKINVQGLPSHYFGNGRIRTIRLIHNTAIQYGGGIYIDDEGNPLSCFKAESLLMGLDDECFFQAQSYYSGSIAKYLFFNFNEVLKGGSDLYGGLFDRCISASYDNGSGPRLRSVQYLLSFNNIKKVSLL